MKKFTLMLLAGAAFGLAGAAQAADVPIAAVPSYKAPVATIPPISGYIGLYGGWERDRQPDGFDTSNIGVFGGEGRVNVWFNSAWSGQLDVEAEGTGHFKNREDGRLYGLIGGHLTYRNPQTWAMGLFGGIVDDNQTHGFGTNIHGLIGYESQYYLGNFTLYTQSGYLGVIDSNKNSANEYQNRLLFSRLVARYFVTPTTKLQAEIGYGSGSYHHASRDKDSILNWGALIETQFSGPWSGFLEYAGSATHNKFEGGREREDLFLAGLKLYFNQQTLQSNNNTGATFDMPRFIRALSITHIAADH